MTFPTIRRAFARAGPRRRMALSVRASSPVSQASSPVSTADASSAAVGTAGRAPGSRERGHHASSGSAGARAPGVGGGRTFQGAGTSGVVSPVCHHVSSRSGWERQRTLPFADHESSCARPGVARPRRRRSEGAPDRFLGSDPRGRRHRSADHGDRPHRPPATSCRRARGRRPRLVRRVPPAGRRRRARPGQAR
jgi:hypothetical protein